MPKDLEARVSAIPAIIGCFMEYGGLLAGFGGTLDLIKEETLNGRSTAIVIAGLICFTTGRIYQKISTNYRQN